MLPRQAREWYREDLVFLALSRSSVPRGDVFLTSKLHPRHHGLRSASRHLNEVWPQPPPVQVTAVFRLQSTCSLHRCESSEHDVLS